MDGNGERYEHTKDPGGWNNSVAGRKPEHEQVMTVLRKWLSLWKVRQVVEVLLSREQE